MKQGIARGWGAACFLLLPVLLGSCMLQSDPRVVAAAGDSPAEARTELLAVLQQTESLVGGDWDRQDDPTPRSCTVQWGLAGVAYPALRLAPLSAGSADAVARAWDRWGYDVSRAAVGPAAQVIARGDGGELLVFRVSDKGMTLQGESACRPAE